jgi:predicted Rossmann-fold nucleotide-binding protein
MIDWMRATQLPAGAISEADLGLLRLTDDPAEVVKIIRTYVAKSHPEDLATIEDEIR